MGTRALATAVAAIFITLTPLSFGSRQGEPRLSIEDPRWSEVTPAAGSPSPRILHVMAYDQMRHLTVLFGGRGSQGEMYTDTWEWDGQNWVLRSPVHSPPLADGNYAMAYDPQRGVSVLYFGGWMNDTWEWDGHDWIETTPANRPPTPSYPALAHSPGYGGILLFDRFSSELFLWNGVDWSTVPAIVTPPAGCSTATFVYDSHRGRAVLHGVLNSTGSSCSDTWEFEGVTWAPASTGFGYVGAASAAFNHDAAVVALFGGNTPNCSLWQQLMYWDGSTWAPAVNGTGPSGRTYAAMVYDTDRRRLVLFGGSNPECGRVPLGDTWEYGATLTPQGAISEIVDQVTSLESQGILNPGQATSLIAKLEQAISAISDGNLDGARGQLTAFLNHCDALQNAGILTSSLADDLAEQAAVVLAQLGR